jgi:hypothetical protein
MPVMPVELPFDILHLIVQRACRLCHPLAYKIDSATLRSLCHVSKSFNHISTPLLYSSIALSTECSILSLAVTAKGNPHLLKSCHSLSLSLFFTSTKLTSAMRDILSSTSALRRFISSGSTWASMLPPLATVLELAYPQQHFYNFRIDNLHAFENLERLTLASMLFKHRYVVNALVAMPRLTHIAVSRFIPSDFYSNKSNYQKGVIRLLTNTMLKRIVYGWILEDWSLEPPTFVDIDPHGHHEELLGPLSENIRAEVVFLMYGSSKRDMEWFTDRIIDGSIWELDE